MIDRALPSPSPLPPPGARHDKRPLTLSEWLVATFIVVAILLHDYVHVREGRYWDIFWVCNVAVLLTGPAVVLRSALLSAAALTWIVPGTVVWLADVLLAGSNILPTSYAVHLGGTAAAVYATRRNGIAPRGWLAAIAVLVACVLVSRFFLPASANVNAAHSIPRGWGFLGTSHGAFAVSVVAIVAACVALGRTVGRAVAGGVEAR